MTDIQQAREWAESVGKIEGLMPGTLAAVEVIQSLPDQWINADRVREVLDMWAGNPSPTSDEVAVLNDFEALLTPPLPTLADMSPEEAREELAKMPASWGCSTFARALETIANLDHDAIYTVEMGRVFVNDGDRVKFPDGTKVTRIIGDWEATDE